MSPPPGGSVTVRPVEPGDVAEVVSMVHDLAAYERAADQCRLTADQLSAALFGPAPALFGHIAPGGDRLAGFALWFLNFSTWQGCHGIYLEDLYVRPEARGSGTGRALLAALAATCVQRGYQRLEWWVLDWNEPATRFYRRVGAQPMDEWTVWRLTGTALADTAVTGTAVTGTAVTGTAVTGTVFAGDSLVGDPLAGDPLAGDAGVATQ